MLNFCILFHLNCGVVDGSIGDNDDDDDDDNDGDGDA